MTRLLPAHSPSDKHGGVHAAVFESRPSASLIAFPMSSRARADGRRRGIDTLVGGGRPVWMTTTKEVAMTDSSGTASLEANLRLGNGLKEHDRERVLRRLAGLDARLRSF